MNGPESQPRSHVSELIELDRARRRMALGGEPLVLHCHHYNTFLQRTILDASYLDSRPFLVGAAEALARAQLASLLDAAGCKTEAERTALAAAVYERLGFGRLDLSGLGPGGGTVQSPGTHYSLAWKLKFGPHREPVDHFTTGWLAGALGAVHGLERGTVTARQEACLAAGDPDCRYLLGRGPSDFALFEAAGMGPLAAPSHEPYPDCGPGYDAVYDGLTSVELVPGDDGLIPAFGVYLTYHYANYYNRISFEFERKLRAEYGRDAMEIARPLLVEAGHVCAFHTFGGLMTSTEWDALVRPALVCPADWVHAAAAAAGALGWGRWELRSISEREAVFAIRDDYESLGYLAMYGFADHPVSYLAEGVASGIMDLVFLGRVEEGPDFSDEYYDRLFRSEESYQTEVRASLAMGAPETVITVRRG